MLAMIPSWYSFLSYKTNFWKLNVVQLFDQSLYLRHTVSDVRCYTLANYDAVTINLQQKLTVFWEYKHKYSLFTGNLPQTYTEMSEP